MGRNGSRGSGTKGKRADGTCLRRLKQQGMSEERQMKERRLQRDGLMLKKESVSGNNCKQS